MAHINNNPRFRVFREALRNKGITIRPMSHIEGPNTFGFVIFNGGRTAPKTMIVVDYGEGDGFGVYFESQSIHIEDDVGTILGGKAL